MASEFKVGDTVRCDNISGWGGRLTQGGLYEVLEVRAAFESPFKIGIIIEDDIGEKVWTFAWRWSLEVPPPEADEDLVEHPSHYARFKIEPIVFAMENDLPFHVASVVKYACRAGHKVYDGMTPEQSEITDWQKAIKFAERRIMQIEGKPLV